MHRSTYLILCISYMLLLGKLSAQEKIKFLETPDSLHKGRFWTCVVAGTVAYSATAVGLYQTWYKDYPISNFHFFNDMGEWEKMDKIGHAFTAYSYSSLAYGAAKWTGMNRKQALWSAFGISTLLQGTVEVMDGFSEKWGFSVGDIAFNTVGTGLFIGQELLWEEQKILFKISSTPPNYSTQPIYSIDGMHTSTLKQRANNLYGSSIMEQLLKDYNGQTYWLSLNLSSFGSPQNKIPKWLNLAVGYGAENMYGGFSNVWEEENGGSFQLNNLPRYHQFYLSPDIDLSRIPTQSKFLQFIFYLFNWIKVPAPAFEMNSQGKVRLHMLRW